MSTVETSPERTVPYSEADSRRWLSWLANAMARNGRTEFLFEELQPSWLASRGTRLTYVFLTRILQGLVCGLMFMGITDAMIAQGAAKSGSTGFWIQITCHFNEVSWGVIAGLALVAFDLWRNSNAGIWKKLVPDTSSLPVRYFLTGVALTLVVGAFLAAAAMVFAVVGLPIATNDPIPSMKVLGRFEKWVTPRELNDYILLGVFAPFVAAINAKGSLRTWDADIECVETLGESWELARWGAFKGVLGAAVAGIVFEQGWPVLLVGGIIGAAFDGLVTKVKDVRSRPNQGIYLSLSYALHYGVFLGGISALIWGYNIWFTDQKNGTPNFMFPVSFCLLGLAFGFLVGKYAKFGGQSFSTKKALFRGGVAGALIGSLIAWRSVDVVVVGGVAAFLSLSLLSGMWFGGLEAIRHFTLRAILFVRGDMPLNFVRFLDYSSTKLIFTERVGGSYMFIHRYLQEHFAQMDLKVESSQETGMRTITAATR